MRLLSNGFTRASVRPGVLTSKGVRVLVAIVLTVAVTGYFVGLRESRQTSTTPLLFPPAKQNSQEKPSNDVVEAATYARLPFKKMGVNRNWQVSLDQLAQPPAAAAPKEPPTPAQRAQCLAERNTRRAFEGAPPVIPHPIAPLGTAVCLTCHEKGLVIGNKVASKMSHPPYVQCTQCHVEASPGNLNETAVLPKMPIERAFASAPASMPHPIWMRENCLSCHGPTGPVGLRTTHPERLSCLQCHAASSPQDAVPHIPSTRKNEP